MVLFPTTSGEKQDHFLLSRGDCSGTIGQGCRQQERFQVTCEIPESTSPTMELLHPILPLAKALDHPWRRQKFASYIDRRRILAESKQ